MARTGSVGMSTWKDTWIRLSSHPETVGRMFNQRALKTIQCCPTRTLTLFLRKAPFSFPNKFIEQMVQNGVP